MSTTLSTTGVQLVQDSKSGMVNGNTIVKSFNERYGKNNHMKDWWRNKETQETYRRHCERLGIETQQVSLMGEFSHKTKDKKNKTTDYSNYFSSGSSQYSIVN